ncbi:MAG TPA: hypothetical protein VM901_06695 [Bdellovibrionota bacterium]|jgi:hypothetical protein|nr:hypothetical protein [Bdellovibrionota bacterium]
MKNFRSYFCVLFLSSLSLIAHAQDTTPRGAIGKCLAAWGKHPFGANPKFKTLSTSVKVFGIGSNPGDHETTDAPALVLLNPAVNVMGGTTYELMNPNGWYCFKANVNVMGGLTVKAHCKAHIASAHSGAVVMGKSTDAQNRGVTVMGRTKVEFTGCN